jgi:hypothetical protein
MADEGLAGEVTGNSADDENWPDGTKFWPSDGGKPWL